VAFVQVGGGAIFGVGQVMFSLAAIGQLGVGLFGWVGQAGFGVSAAGSAVARRLPPGEAGEFGEELNALLRWK
jgi:hypothetical protein